MRSQNVRINPVKGTCWKYQGRDYGIQGLNDTCFGICAAFSGTNDVYSMDPDCSQACTNLIEERKVQIFGVGSCDHQVPYRPVIWEQVPRYVPSLLKKGLTPEEALQGCLNMCQKHNLAEDCQEKCQIDYHSIEQYDDKQYDDKNSAKLNIESNNKSKKSSSHQPNSLVISLIVFASIVIISFILLYFLRR
jgi:hypothetical protein